MAIGAFDYSPREIVLGRGLTATSCVGQVTHGEPALDSSSFAMFAAIRRASARPLRRSSSMWIRVDMPQHGRYLLY